MPIAIEILKEVYRNENPSIYTEIVENKNTEEYLVVDCQVTNNLVVTRTYFTNNFDGYKKGDGRNANRI